MPAHPGARGSTLLRLFHLSLSSVRPDSRRPVAVFSPHVSASVGCRYPHFLSIESRNLHPSPSALFNYSSLHPPPIHLHHTCLFYKATLKTPSRGRNTSLPTDAKFQRRKLPTASTPLLPLFANDFLMHTHVWIWRASGMAPLKPY